MPKPPSPWLDRKGAALYLCCSPWTIDRFKRRGALAPKFIGSKPIYHVNDLDKLVSKQPEPV